MKEKEKRWSQTRCLTRTGSHKEAWEMPFDLSKKCLASLLWPLRCPIPWKDDMKQATVSAAHPGVSSQRNGAEIGPRKPELQKLEQQLLPHKRRFPPCRAGPSRGS